MEKCHICRSGTFHLVAPESRIALSSRQRENIISITIIITITFIYITIICITIIITIIYIIISMLTRYVEPATSFQKVDLEQRKANNM